MTLSGHRGVAWAGVAALALVTVLSGQSPARAEGVQSPGTSRNLAAGEALLAAVPGGPVAPASGFAAAQEPSLRFADVHCGRDARGDTFVVVADGDTQRRQPFAQPRADIVEFCADYGETLTLRLRVAEPTDPSTAWSEQTGLYWYLDTTGDGRFDRAVTYERGQAGPVATVAHPVDGSWHRLDGCTAQAAYEDGHYVTRGIEAGCLDHAHRLDVGAVMLFETASGQVVHDTTDYRLPVGRAGAPTARATQRLAGADRYATAVTISRARFPTRPAAAYLARADGFADALAAGSLAASAATRGPILLVPSCAPLPEVVRAEIARLDPPEVVALGGGAAVCDDVLAEAGEAGGARRTTTRLAGDAAEPTRWGTAVAVSRHAYPVGGVEEVYLATGEDFPDALASGPLDQGPLLLVPSCDELPEAVVDELRRLAPRRVVALGGEAAVCDDVLAQAIAVAGGDVLSVRLAGPTRYGTAAEVSVYRFPGGAGRVYVARADDFPDALAGAMLGGGPILLLPRCGDLPPSVVREIRRLDPGEVVALGGPGAVCDQTLRHAANA